MELLNVNHDDGSATYGTDLLTELADKHEALAINVEENDVYFLCKHPKTGKMGWYQVTEIVEAETPEKVKALRAVKDTE